MTRPRLVRRPVRRGRWTCDTCGATGEIPAGETVDTISCHVCGEPVTSDG